MGLLYRYYEIAWEESMKHIGAGKSSSLIIMWPAW
jgi:hypothetical protein